MRSNDQSPITGQAEQNVHVWNYDGLLNGYTPVSSDSGTFSVTRTGSTLAGYFDGSLIFSETNSLPLTEISFVLQNYAGNDPISVTFDNFVLTTASVPEPSSFFMGIIGLGIVAGRLALVRRRASPRASDRPGADG